MNETDWLWRAGLVGRGVLVVLCLVAAGCTYAPPAEQGGRSAERCVEEGRVLNVGFYAYFAPVSYSADEDPDAEGFQTHLGYEADLLTALEAMEGAGFAFARHPIAVWDDIWLLAATPQYDIVGGGITILDSRTVDAAGRKAVAFTAGHVAFRQSLLVRAEDEGRLAGYDDLTGGVRVGALAGTTGEFRLLELVGLVDGDGVLAAGVRVETPGGAVVADGGPDYVITAAGESDSLAGRRHLHPPSDDMPQVVYLGDETGETALFEALEEGRIDAIARGEIGNRETAHARGGDFVVTALDEDVEYGGFALAAEDGALAACLQRMIDWLTDDRKIGYASWREDAGVFMRRAALWNAAALTQEGTTDSNVPNARRIASDSDAEARELYPYHHLLGGTDGPDVLFL
ncbi:MAG: transporter substrate-binding domain-containing protein [Caldilineaceae bacterium]|nr:transporter substrate-binding domain-containing protein [Caldilineaceae bacterium]